MSNAIDKVYGDQEARLKKTGPIIILFNDWEETEWSSPVSKSYDLIPDLSFSKELLQSIWLISVSSLSKNDIPEAYAQPDQYSPNPIISF